MPCPPKKTHIPSDNLISRWTFLVLRYIDARAFDLTGNAAFVFLGGIDWENSHVAWSVQHGILSFLFQEWNIISIIRLDVNNLAKYFQLMLRYSGSLFGVFYIVFHIYIYIFVSYIYLYIHIWGWPAMRSCAVSLVPLWSLLLIAAPFHGWF